MRLFNFAIASIVDVNTGSGINRQFVEQFGSKQSANEQAGRAIRAKSVLDVLIKIKSTFKQYIDDSRAAARAKRSIAEITQLSDLQLDDIGLTSVDIQDLKSGQISLEALNTRRDQYRDQAALNNLLVEPTKRVSSRVVDIDSANQAHYEIAKCA